MYLQMLMTSFTVVPSGGDEQMSDKCTTYVVLGNPDYNCDTTSRTKNLLTNPATRGQVTTS